MKNEQLYKDIQKAVSEWKAETVDISVRDLNIYLNKIHKDERIILLRDMESAEKNNRIAGLQISDGKNNFEGEFKTYIDLNTDNVDSVLKVIKIKLKEFRIRYYKAI